MANYQGVTIQGSKFKVLILRGAKQYYLGTFTDEESAAYHYDRAARLTEPWMTRRTAYNFSRPNTVEEITLTLTLLEKSMLDDLSKRMPDRPDEKIKFLADTKFIPDVMMESLEREGERAKAHAERTKDMYGEMRRCFLDMAGRLRESEKLIDMYRAQVSGLEQKVSELQRSASAPKSYQFRRVLEGGVLDTPIIITPRKIAKDLPVEEKTPDPAVSPLVEESPVIAETVAAVAEITNLPPEVVLSARVKFSET